jgi:hypothetical protein
VTVASSGCNAGNAARRATRLALLCAAVVCASQAGCVTRRLTIISDPPGATVFVDNDEVGVTPCSVSYIYYGTRQITLVKDGYETRTAMQELPAPWYEYFPIEFVSENLIPWELRDERTVEFKLLPQVLTPVSQILQRGEDLRQGVQGQRLQAPPGLPLTSPPGIPPAGLAPPAPPPFGAPPLPSLPPRSPMLPQINLGAQPSPTAR